MRINNKGYAITIIVFGILIVFVTVLSTLLITMNNSVKLNKTVKEEVIESVQLSADTSGMSLTERISQLENQMANIKKEIYPVGSIYISAEDDTVEKVKERFGGEWEKYAQGRTLVGVGTATDENGNVLTYNSNQTGGSSLIQLSTSNLPSHSHRIPSLSGTAASTGSGYSIGYTYASRTSAASNIGNLTFYGASGYTGTSNGYAALVNSSYYSHSAGTTPYYLHASGGSHTHTYSDYFANSISGVAPHTHSVTTTASNTGASESGTSFSVQDPYITVYMYKRTE